MGLSEILFSMPDKSIAGAATPENAKERLRLLVTRIEQELDSMIRMFAFARESLENEMLSGLGFKQHGLQDTFPKKLKELTLGMNSLVETKIKWDKAKKQLGEQLTPEEERAACVQYILSLTDNERHLLRDALSDRGVYKWKS